MIIEAGKNKSARDNSLHAKVQSALSSITESNVELFTDTDAAEQPQHLLVDGKDHKLASNGTQTCLRFYAIAFDSVHHDCLILWDEPENGLHATRRHYLLGLMKDARQQFILGTHATELAPVTDKNVGIYSLHRENNARVSTLNEVQNRTDALFLLDSLGVQASTALFTANVVLWVEGPSDLIFWSWAIANSGHNLEPGFDYTIMQFGGSNLKNSSISGEPEDEGFDFLSVSRHPIVLVDSDAKDLPEWNNIPDTFPKPYAKHAHSELEALRDSRGADSAYFGWTWGREVENYLPSDAVDHAVTVLGCLDDEQQRILRTASIGVGRFDNCYDKIKNRLIDRGITVKNNKGQDVAKGISKWRKKTDFLRTALSAPQLTLSDIKDPDGGVRAVIDFIKNRRESVRMKP